MWDRLISWPRLGTSCTVQRIKLLYSSRDPRDCCPYKLHILRPTSGVVKYWCRHFKSMSIQCDSYSISGPSPLPQVMIGTQVQGCNQREAHLVLQVSGRTRSELKSPVYMLHQYTCWISIHVASVYMLHQYTCCISIHVGAVYMLEQYTCWISVDNGRGS